MRAPVRAAAIVALLSVLAAPVVDSHEVGTTIVKVLMRGQRSYVIEIVTDATALAEKLEASTGVPRGTDRSPATLEALLAASDEIVRRRLRVGFDDSAVRPEIAYGVAPQADATLPPLATVTLTGDVPPGARDFTWTYGWTFTPYVLTVRHDEAEASVTQWLDGGDASTPVPVSPAPPAPARLATAWRYLTLGFTHILPYGVDHVLFVLGLFLLSGRLRTVLWQASAFTVAHSITLGLGIFGVVAAPASIVEPLIALSIAYIAIENLFLSELKSWRLALVFAFGLLHGLGFAGVLGEFGLPRSEFVTALVTFNIGVEAGQLAVLGAAFLLVGWNCDRPWYRRRVVVPASLLIACTAVYWTVERLAV